MRLLALDASRGVAGAAILDEERVLACRSAAPGGRLADDLVPTVLAAMAAAGLGFPDIDAIAVPVGPGGFSAVRVCLAAARGLALAADRPILPVGALDVEAEAAGEDASAPLAVVVDAHRGQLFWALFGGDLSPIGQVSCHPVEVVAGSLPDRVQRLAGDGSALLRPHLRRPLAQSGTVPDAVTVARAARRRLSEGAQPRSGYEVVPRYLRAPDARITAGRPLIGAAG